VGDTSGTAGRVVSSTTAITVDTSAPAQTTTITSVNDNVGFKQGTLASETSTDDTTPTLSGTISAVLTGAQVVAVYDTVNGQSVRLGTATVSGTTWNYTPSALSAGMHSFNVQVENPTKDFPALNKGTTGTLAAGVASTAFVINVGSITLDAVVDDVGLVKGVVAAGGYTDDVSPTMGGSLGAALLSTEQVGVYNGNTRLGTATVSGTSWTFTASNLAPGSYSLNARIEDALGNVLVGSHAYGLGQALTVLDPQPISATASISTVTDDVGLLQGTLLGMGQSTDDSTLALSGTISRLLNTSAGEVVAIYNGTTRLGTATVSGIAWSYTTPALSGGPISLRAQVENPTTAVSALNVSASGTVGAGVASSAFVANLESISLDSVLDDEGTVMGKLASGDLTDDSTPTVTGSLSWVLPSTEQVGVYNGNTRLGTATVNGTSWSYTASALAIGSYNINARIEDASSGKVLMGSHASGAGFAITLVPPNSISTSASISTVADNVGFRQGTATTGQSMDDSTLALGGTISGPLNTSAGEVVAIYNGSTRLGTATVSGSTWTYTTPALSAGIVSLRAQVENPTIAPPALNTGISGTTATGVASTAFTTNLTSINIDSVSSHVGTATQNVGTMARYIYLARSNWVSTDKLNLNEIEVWSGDVNLALNATISNSLSQNVSAWIDGSRFTNFTSTDDRFSPNRLVWVELDLGGNYLVSKVSAWTPANVGTNSGGLSVLASKTSLQGVLPSVAQQTAGVTLLGTMPTYVSATESIFWSTGNSTTDRRPTLAGSLSASLLSGESVKVYDAGVAVEGTLTLSGLSWSFTPSQDLSIGSHQLTAVVLAADGVTKLTSISTGANFVLTIDSATTTIDNVASIVSVVDDVGTNTGALTSGQSTDDAALQLSGTLTKALSNIELVGIYSNGVRLGAATVSGLTWAYTTTALSGAQSIQAQVEKAGATYALNTVANSTTASKASDPFAVAVNTVSVSDVTDNLGAVTGKALAKTYRYVYLQMHSGNSGYWMTLSEIQVVSNGVNIAKTATVTTGSSSGSFTTAPYNLIDGNINTQWTSSSASNLWVQLDFGKEVSIDQIGISSTAQVTDSRNISVYTGNTKMEGLSESNLISVGAFFQGITPGAGLTAPWTANVVALRYVDDTQPILHGVLSSTLKVSESLALYDGDVKLSATVDVNGLNWSVKSSALTVGTHQLSVRLLDANNTIITSSTQQSVVVINPDAVTTVATISLVADDVGVYQTTALKSGILTDDASLLVSGFISTPLKNNEYIALYNNSSFLGYASVTSTNWTYQTSNLSGAVALTARVVNVTAGTNGDLSSAFVTSIETISLTSIVNHLTGASLSSNSFSTDLSPTISGSLSTALTSNTRLMMCNENQVLGQITTFTDSTHWAYTPSTPLAVGKYSFNVRIEDTSAGNQLLLGSHPLGTGVDVTLVNTETVVSTTSSVASVFANGMPISGYQGFSDLKPVVTGLTTEALKLGEVVAIYDGTQRLGEATVLTTSWTFTPTSPFTAGIHHLTSRVENPTNNINGSSSTDFVVNLISLVDDVGFIQGAITTTSDTTDDAKPTLSGEMLGALSAGKEIAVYETSSGLNQYLGVAATSLNSNGNTVWTYTPASNLSDGAHNFTVVMQDTGNNSMSQATTIREKVGFTVNSSAELDATTHTYAFLGDNQTLDLTGIANISVNRIDSVKMNGVSGLQQINHLVLDVNDVMLAGTGLYLPPTATQTLYFGPVDSSRHQLLVTANDSKGTINVAGVATDWTYMGLSYGPDRHTYRVYDHNTQQAELLVDQQLIRSGAIL
jgi:F5/8 type C domain